MDNGRPVGKGPQPACLSWERLLSFCVFCASLSPWCPVYSFSFPLTLPLSRDMKQRRNTVHLFSCRLKTPRPLHNLSFMSSGSFYSRNFSFYGKTFFSRGVRVTEQTGLELYLSSPGFSTHLPSDGLFSVDLPQHIKSVLRANVVACILENGLHFKAVQKFVV